MAAIGGNAVTSVAPAIAVTTGPVSLSKSFLSPSSASLASGNGVTVTLQAEDAAGNKLTTGGLAVAFAAGSCQRRSSATFSAITDNGNGTYTATFTGTTGGTNTIMATIGGQAVTSTAPAVTVTIGPVSLAKSFVTAAFPSIASGGVDTVTLQAEDAAGNKFTTGGLTVAFALGSSGGAPGARSVRFTDNKNGTYTATFTGTTAGSNSITATIGGQNVTATAPAVTITPVASLLTSIVSLSSASVASGSGVTVTLQTKDANGNNLTAGGLAVKFALASTSGGQGTFGSVTDNHNGTYTATFTGTIAGANTIKATIGGNAVTSTAPCHLGDGRPNQPRKVGRDTVGGKRGLGQRRHRHSASRRRRRK